MDKGGNGEQGPKIFLEKWGVCGRLKDDCDKNGRRGVKAWCGLQIRGHFWMW